MKKIVLVMLSICLCLPLFCDAYDFETGLDLSGQLTTIPVNNENELFLGFSQPGGFYTDDVSLELTTTHQASIYYTLDGSLPSAAAILYQEPIHMTTQVIPASGQEVIIQRQIPEQPIYPEPVYPLSMIRTSSDKWISPRNDIFKATVVRAIAVDDFGNQSTIQTHTYFIDQQMDQKYTFPIISITTDAKHLFSYETGINVPGIYYDPSIEDLSAKNRTGNYFQEGEAWERPIHIEYFEHDGQLAFSQDAGIRIHGGLSRKYAIKSYRLYARSEYGNNAFDYQFFKDKETDSFKRLILRAGGQTYEYTFMGEAAAQSLLKPLDLDMQYSQPAILFINGEYFGIRNIRDRLDTWHLSTAYNIDREDITILTGNAFHQEGSEEGVSHYSFIYGFITSRDMSKRLNYEFVKSQIDVENFIDYYITQLYYANVDWPQNNVLYWRYNTRYHPNLPAGQDGRWRWMIYDVDAGFAASWGGNTPDYNSIERMTDVSWKTGKMFVSLLENPEFKNNFITRYGDLLNTVFKEERVIDIVEQMKTQYEPEMREHIARFGYPSSYVSWSHYVDKMKTFADGRPAYVRTHLGDYFDLEGSSDVHIDYDTHQGNVYLNSIDLSDEVGLSTNWQGTYLNNTFMRLLVSPAEGYRFKGWYDKDDHLISNDITYTFELENETTLTAVFEVGVHEDIQEPSWLITDALWFLTILMSLLATLFIYRYEKKRTFKIQI